MICLPRRSSTGIEQAGRSPFIMSRFYASVPLQAFKDNHIQTCWVARRAWGTMRVYFHPPMPSKTMELAHRGNGNVYNIMVASGLQTRDS